MNDNTFVFVAPMFNASATLGQMLASVCTQSYPNWKVILIDDMSDQHEAIHQNEIINSWRDMTQPGWRGMNGDFKHDKIHVIWNDDKKWEVANVLHGIGMCDDNDVVCRIDGDDYLTDLDALVILNAAYNQTGADIVWSNHRWGFSDKNISGPMPVDADPYSYPWVSSHLKTFRKRLINDINDANFRGEDGQYIRRTGDQAIFLPLLSRTKKRLHVPRCLYHYTIQDIPETYQTDDAKFQRDEALFLRARGYVP